jgi:hypothetical protein
MRQANAFHSTPHRENLSRILHHALRLAELAGKEQDAVRRDDLIAECMTCWRAAQIGPSSRWQKTFDALLACLAATYPHSYRGSPFASLYLE